MEIYSLSYLRNKDKVIMPDGHTGKVCITIRERKLLLKNNSMWVSVLCTDGLIRKFRLKDLEPYVEDLENLENKTTIHQSDSVGNDEVFAKHFRCPECKDSWIIEVRNYCANCGIKLVFNLIDETE